MRLVSAGVRLGMAVSAVACSSGLLAPAPSGRVAVQVTLSGAAPVRSLHFSLRNGDAADDLSGAIPLPTTAATAVAVPTYEIASVSAANEYGIALTGTSSDGTTICTGSAGPFAVTAENETTVNVLVTCTSTVVTEDCCEANPIVVLCPTLQTLRAIPSGSTYSIFAAASDQNQAEIGYAFTVSGGGSLSDQTYGTGNSSSRVTFTCPSTASSSVITVTAIEKGPPPLVCSSQTLAGDTTCAQPSSASGTACDSGGTCIEVVCPSELTSASTTVKCKAPAPPSLVPCTTAGQTQCVSCAGNSSGLCSPTEAAFVTRDIQLGIATTAGDDPPAGCYTCLVGASCIDDTVQGVTGKECEDDSGAAAYSAGTTANECEAVLDCVLGSGTGATECAASDVAACYCGTDPSSACALGSALAPVPTGVDGVCAAQIAAGLAFPLGDGSDTLSSLSDPTRAAGRANQIFSCAASNLCSNCL